ncbi:MAG TPA: YfiR family protein [Usitatibacter sp.]
MARASRPGGRCLAFAATLVAFCGAAHADQAAESDLKTAYAYNFVVLSTWPAGAHAALRFCVAGAQPGSTAFHVLGGKGAGDRSLSVINVPSPDRVADCQILYILPAESKRLDAWLAAVAKQPTLTISDEGAGPGAMVNLRRAGSQIVFDVDTRAAAAAHIGLSSQLIKLAATRQ